LDRHRLIEKGNFVYKNVLLLFYVGVFFLEVNMIKFIVGLVIGIWLGGIAMAIVQINKGEE
jgi:hypothetical protein